MNTYNGYKSHSQWNQVLWLSNDYNVEMQLREYRDKGYSKTKTVNLFWSMFKGKKTGDGVKYNKSGVKSYVEAAL